MEIGVCTIANKPAAVESVMEVADEAGATGVEPWGEDHINPATPDRAQEIRSVADRLGLRIPVYGSYLRAGTESFDEELDQELAIAEALSAEQIRVWAGEQEFQDVSESHWDRVIADLETLGERAAEEGLGVTVERHAGTVTNTTVGARKTIEQTPDSVGLNYQPLFEHDAEEVASDIAELSALATNVHLQAVPAPGESERCPLAFAYFDINGIIEELSDAGFDGYLEVEFVSQRAPFAASLASDIACLQRLRG